MSSSLWQKDWGLQYVAATVCEIGNVILAHLLTGHLTELSCSQPAHTHGCSMSIMTTGVTALLIPNIQLPFHSPLVAMWLNVYSKNSSPFNLQGSLYFPVWEHSRTEVYCACSLFEWYLNSSSKMLTHTYWDIQRCNLLLRNITTSGNRNALCGALKGYHNRSEETLV